MIKVKVLINTRSFKVGESYDGKKSDIFPDYYIVFPKKSAQGVLLQRWYVEEC